MRIGEGFGPRDREDLVDLIPAISTLLRPAVHFVGETWSERAPLRDIIDHGAIHMVGQPIVELTTGRLAIVEALCRFDDGTSPADRFAEATRVGLSLELEQLALGRALAEGARLPEGVALAVNLSSLSFLDRSTRSMLATFERPLVVEITEHEAVEDYGSLLAAVAELPLVRLAVDDTGSGYSSLSHVLHLNPAFVKLDIALVSGIDRDAPRRAAVRGLVALAGELDAQIIAEGVERQEEVDTLRGLGVTHFRAGWSDVQRRSRRPDAGSMSRAHIGSPACSTTDGGCRSGGEWACEGFSAAESDLLWASPSTGVRAAMA